MFTVIDFKNFSKKKSIYGFINRRFNNNKIYIEKCEEFYILHYNNYGNKIKWKKIAKKCPTKDVVLTGDLPVPKNFPLRCYNSSRYRRYILEQTTEKILTNIDVVASKKNLLIIDENAEHCGFINSIAKECAGIYVITNSGEKYIQVQRDLMKDIGLYLSICTKIPNKNNIILCIAFSDISCYNNSLMDIPTFVMNKNKNIDMEQKLPCDISFVGPHSFCYEKLLPSYIDKFGVCGALRDINQVVYDDYCEKFIIGGDELDFKEMLLFLKRNISS
ncbi:MAG: hypothetical protein RR048_01335 [Oscillospiraceae bacterium]